MNFPYIQRSAEVRTKVQAKLAAQKAAYEHQPKVERPKVLAEMAVLGKTVAEWEKEVALLEEMYDDQRRATGKLEVLDMVEHFHPQVTFAVYAWRDAGKPTEYDETASRLARMRDEAEKWAALAITEDGKVQKFEEMKNEKKAAQHRKYAQTNRDKAAKFLAEAEALEIEYRKEHP